MFHKPLIKAAVTGVLLISSLSVAERGRSGKIKIGSGELQEEARLKETENILKNGSSSPVIPAAKTLNLMKENLLKEKANLENSSTRLKGNLNQSESKAPGSHHETSLVIPERDYTKPVPKARASSESFYKGKKSSIPWEERKEVRRKEMELATAHKEVEAFTLESLTTKAASQRSEQETFMESVTEEAMKLASEMGLVTDSNPDAKANLERALKLVAFQHFEAEKQKMERAIKDGKKVSMDLEAGRQALLDFIRDSKGWLKAVPNKVDGKPGLKENSLASILSLYHRTPKALKEATKAMTEYAKNSKDVDALIGKLLVADSFAHPFWKSLAEKSSVWEAHFNARQNLVAFLESKHLSALEIREMEGCIQQRANLTAALGLGRPAIMQ